MPTLRTELELEVVWNGGELPPRASRSLAVHPSVFIDAPEETAQRKAREDQRRRERRQARQGSGGATNSGARGSGRASSNDVHAPEKQP